MDISKGDFILYQEGNSWAVGITLQVWTYCYIIDVHKSADMGNPDFLMVLKGADTIHRLGSLKTYLSILEYLTFMDYRKKLFDNAMESPPSLTERYTGIFAEL